MAGSEGRGRYGRLLRVPHARGLLLAEFPARLPIGINAFALVLFAREHAGSYAIAGVIAACFGAGLGLSSPFIGRLIDHRGLQAIAPPMVVAHVVAMVALVVLGLSDAPAGVLAILAALAGVFLPPLGSITRSMWPRILQDHDPGLLSTALALEGVFVEVIFVAGPLLVAGIVLVASPAVALLLSAGLLAVGYLGYLAQPPVRSWVVSEHAGTHGMLGALRSPGVRTIALCLLPMGFCFGAIEVTLPAFAEGHGHRTFSGVLLAVWSAASATGGLLYGSRSWPTPLLRRFARLSALLPIGYLPLVLAPSLLGILPLLVLAGLCIAPALTAANELTGEVAAEGTETEAYTWPTTALVLGLAIGNWVAGALVDGSSARAAFASSAVAGCVAAALAIARSGTLQRSAALSR